MISSFFDDVNSLDCYTEYLSIFRWWSHHFNPLSYCDVTPPPPPLRRTPRLLLLKIICKYPSLTPYGQYVLGWCLTHYWCSPFLVLLSYSSGYDTQSLRLSLAIQSKFKIQWKVPPAHSLQSGLQCRFCSLKSIIMYITSNTLGTICISKSVSLDL